MNLRKIITKNTVASFLVAVLAGIGAANGTVAVIIIGAIHIVDLPALIRVIGQEAREGC